MRTLFSVLLLLGSPLLGQDPAPAPEDPHRLKPDHERTPFSAAEIRSGCPAGRVSMFRIWNPNQKALQVFKFLESNDEGAVFEVAMLSADGKQVQSTAKNRSSWTGFQSHASFPKSMTTRSEKRVKTPAGTFDCWQYLVVQKTPRGPAERRFYFAKKIPGPPVKVTMHLEGKKQFEMVMIEHRSGQEAAWKKAMGFKGDASASAEAKAKYAAEFAKLDKPVETEAEFVKRRIHETEALALFTAMDKDANRKLSRDEFASGAGIADAKMNKRVFFRLDHDADGVIGRDEFVKVTGGWAP